MRKFWLLIGLSWAMLLPVSAQGVVARSIKDFLAGKCDTVTTLKQERRSKSQVLMTGGADYKFSASETELKPKFLRNRCGIVRYEGKLYVNCKKLRYKKLKFGNWYAPAVVVDSMIYFVAVPLGSVVAGSESMDVKLGGTVGDAIAASNQVSRRVCYRLDPQTHVVEFMSCENMAQLLDRHPELLSAYLKEVDNETSFITLKYLEQLRELKE